MQQSYHSQTKQSKSLLLQLCPTSDQTLVLPYIRAVAVASPLPKPKLFATRVAEACDPKSAFVGTCYLGRSGAFKKKTPPTNCLMLSLLEKAC
jgi:hypothetical protein